MICSNHVVLCRHGLPMVVVAWQVSLSGKYSTKDELLEGEVEEGRWFSFVFA